MFCTNQIKKRKRNVIRDRIPYLFTIEKMMSCIPIAVFSSPATIAVIEIPPNPKSIPVPTVVDPSTGDVNRTNHCSIDSP